MLEIHLIKKTITKSELKKIAREQFGNLVKAAVDVKQEIMAVGGELHSDEEAFLIEKCGAKRKDIWGINLYPDKAKDEMLEFDSIINIKPSCGNRSRDVENGRTKSKIKEIVDKLISG